MDIGKTVYLNTLLILIAVFSCHKLTLRLTSLLILCTTQLLQSVKPFRFRDICRGGVYNGETDWKHTEAIICSNCSWIYWRRIKVSSYQTMSEVSQFQFDRSAFRLWVRSSHKRLDWLPCYFAWVFRTSKPSGLRTRFLLYY